MQIVKFIKECKTEIKDKTTWPTKETVLNYTIVVLVSVILVSAFLFLIDYISKMIFIDGLWGKTIQNAQGITQKAEGFITRIRPYFNDFSLLILIGAVIM